MLSPEPVKYDSHVVQVIILILGEGDHVIQVDQAIGEVQFPPSNSVLIAKSPMLTLKETQWPHHKGSVLLGLLIHLHLPKAWFEVKAGKYARPLQAF